MDKELERLREEIDAADRDILDALGRRMRVVAEIGKRKEEIDMDVFDAKRHEHVLDSRTEWGAERGLAAKFVQELFEAIIKHAKELQKK